VNHSAATTFPAAADKGPAASSARTTSASVPTRPNEQHGRRLTAAFEALEGFPALAESQTRLIAALDADPVDPSAIVAALETDLGLGLGVLRIANRLDTTSAGRISSIAAAIEVVTPPSLRVLAERTRTVDYFDRAGSWGREADSHRRHVAAVQTAIHRIGAVLGDVDVETLSSAALLHDVGKLVLLHAHAGYPEKVLPREATPEERIVAERRELGVDHALVGGVLVRRWGLPRELARLVERHHADDVDRDVAVLRLADLIAHHGHGDDVSPQAIMRVARSIGIEAPQLRALLYDQAVPSQRRARSAAPCPLSGREMEVLRRLAAGRVYKQIAGELGLSTSTVRTHLHNIYGKLGAVDRAQAVLIAVERGWL
jgi:putative nucleotidyltransferase with HDIG domain